MFKTHRDWMIAVAMALTLGSDWQSTAVFAQSAQPMSKEDALLVVEGVVQQVFSSTIRANRTDYVVQIEVRKSDPRKAANTVARVRFPAPGEVVYVHVHQQPKSVLSPKADSYTAVPVERAAVRAYLSPREHGTWQGTYPDWFDPISESTPQSPAPSVANGPDRPAVANLGMTFEPVTVKDRLVLRVKSIERGGPAQQAGIEVGDVIIGVNEQPLQSAGQLGQLAQRGQSISLMVVDVNTSRTTRLELRPIQTASDAPAGDKPAPRRSLGLSAEPVYLGQRTVLKVTRVEEGGPAQKAGIEPDDILVAANGAPLTGPEQLGNALRKSGATLSLTVRDSRTGKDVAVEVALGGPAVESPSSESVPTFNAAKGGLGAVTELAFYDVEAVVKVTEVESGSPAARAGLKPGHMILEADGKPVLHPNELNDIVRNSTGTLRLTVADPRTGAKSAVQVDLGR